MDANLLDLAVFLVRERNRVADLAKAHPDLPTLTAHMEGRTEGYEMALAYVAGMSGFTRREALEATVSVELARREALEYPAVAATTAEPMGGWEPRS